MRAPKIRHPFNPSSERPNECAHCGCRAQAHPDQMPEDSLASWQRRLKK